VQGGRRLLGPLAVTIQNLCALCALCGEKNRRIYHRVRREHRDGLGDLGTLSGTHLSVTLNRGLNGVVLLSVLPEVAVWVSNGYGLGPLGPLQWRAHPINLRARLPHRSLLRLENRALRLRVRKRWDAP